MLLPGRNPSSSRMSSRQSRSSATAKCATPLFALCVIAPPRSSFDDVLVRDRLDDVGPGHEHVARALDHHREVGDRRRVDGAARARPHDGRDLRNDARGQRVAEEDVGVSRQRHHAFLDPRPARVVETHHRRALSHGQVHDLHDLRRVGLRQRPAEHREVLREGVDDAPVDAAEARHDPVTGDHLVFHPEVAAPVHDELVDLLEGPRVEQELHPLPRRQLAGLVLTLEARLSASQFGRPLQLGQLFACCSWCHRGAEAAGIAASTAPHVPPNDVRDAPVRIEEHPQEPDRGAASVAPRPSR